MLFWHQLYFTAMAQKTPQKSRYLFLSVMHVILATTEEQDKKLEHYR